MPRGQGSGPSSHGTCMQRPRGFRADWSRSLAEGPSGHFPACPILDELRRIRVLGTFWAPLQHHQLTSPNREAQPRPTGGEVGEAPGQAECSTAPPRREGERRASACFLPSRGTWAKFMTFSCLWGVEFSQKSGLGDSSMPVKSCGTQVSRHVS